MERSLAKTRINVCTLLLWPPVKSSALEKLFGKSKSVIICLKKNTRCFCFLLFSDICGKIWLLHVTGYVWAAQYEQLCSASCAYSSHSSHEQALRYFLSLITQFVSLRAESCIQQQCVLGGCQEQTRVLEGGRFQPQHGSVDPHNAGLSLGQRVHLWSCSTRNHIGFLWNLVLQTFTSLVYKQNLSCTSQVSISLDTFIDHLFEKSCIQ